MLEAMLGVAVVSLTLRLPRANYDVAAMGNVCPRLCLFSAFLRLRPSYRSAGGIMFSGCPSVCAGVCNVRV